MGQNKLLGETRPNYSGSAEKRNTIASYGIRPPSRDYSKYPKVLINSYIIVLFAGRTLGGLCELLINNRCMCIFAIVCGNILRNY